jgi:hypothetical protein
MTTLFQLRHTLGILIQDLSARKDAMPQRKLAPALTWFVLLASLSLPLGQTARSTDLAAILTGFFDPDHPTLTLAPPPPGFPSHETHFDSEPAAQETMRLLNASIVSQLSTFPLGSSSGSFTYTYDSSLGVFQRSTDTFGPSFAERAQTNGKGKFSVGLGYKHSEFKGIDGVRLGDGEIALYLTHDPNQPPNIDLFFKHDIIETRLFITLKSDTFAFYANYGLTDRFDIGVAVPISSVDMQTRIHAQVQPLGSGDLPIHRFVGGANGGLDQDFSEGGSASGIGDVLARAKFRLTSAKDFGLALAADVRLPTGDEKNLLGTGSTQAKLYLVGSGSLGKINPHANVGGTMSFGSSDIIGDLPNEFDYTVGFDASLHERVSLDADVIGRTLINANRLVNGDRTFKYFLYTQQGPPPPPPSEQLTTTRVESSIQTANQNLLLGAIGLKLNPFSNFILSGNVFVPLNNNGLRADITLSVGADYSF